MSEFQRQINRYKHHGASLRQWMHYLRWKKSFSDGANSMRDRQPWITFDAIDTIRRHIDKTSKVFEFGGGGSTLFFLDHVHEVVTVEHNREWYALLAESLNTDERKKWKGILREASAGKIGDEPKASVPSDYYTTDEHYINMNFKAYASAIDEFGDGYFDLVLVDGRSRPACIMHGIPKIKVGGLLVLDNSDRDYYLENTLPEIQRYFVPILSNQGASPYSNEFSRTSIWKRIRS